MISWLIVDYLRVFVRSNRCKWKAVTSNYFYQPFKQMQRFKLASKGGCLPLNLGISAEDDAAEKG
jgi:hypothetical protein